MSLMNSIGSLDRLPSNCTRVVFDIGTNSGSDTLAFLARRFCVIGVDANPNMASLTAARASAHLPNVRILNRGLDTGDADGNLTFYVNAESPIHSSFEEAKARKYLLPDKQLQHVKVPGASCTLLWSYVPEGVRPAIMKVDIEERHYVCIEALLQLTPRQLPRFISWEMHEFAKGLPYPILDAELLVRMSRLGYTSMKVVGNRWQAQKHQSDPSLFGGAFSGGLLPEEVRSDILIHSGEYIAVMSWCCHAAARRLWTW